MDWLKLNSKGILRGSLASSDNITQLIWIKFLAMANETRDRDGFLRYKVGEPYTLDFIAQVCHVSRNELDIAIDDFLEDVRDGVPRIEFTEDGSLKLNNWQYYQKQSSLVDAPKRLKDRLKIPLSPEDSEAAQQAAAARLGYLQPEAAQRGINTRGIEKAGKDIIERDTDLQGTIIPLVTKQGIANNIFVWSHIHWFPAIFNYYIIRDIRLWFRLRRRRRFIKRSHAKQAILSQNRVVVKFEDGTERSYFHNTNFDKAVKNEGS